VESSAWEAGIDFEPEAGHCGEFGQIEFDQVGHERKSPPHWVVNSPSSSENMRTSATG